MFGGPGNDDLYGGGDSDSLRCGSGNDDYYSDHSDDIFDDSDDFSSNGDFEIRGDVSNFDSTSQTFRVLGILVNYSNAEFAANVQNGSLVKVEGAYQGSVLNAHEVELEVDDDRDENFEARGVISNLNSNNQTFSFLGFNVSYSSSSIEGQLANGQTISIEGRLTGTQINAFRIETGNGDGGSGGNDDNNDNDQN